MTGEGTFCTVTGKALAGPELVTYDYTHLCNAINRPAAKRFKRARGARSLKLKRQAAGGLRSFAEAAAKMHLATSPDRVAAAARGRERAVRGARKIMSRPATLRSAMTAAAAVRARNALGGGAPQEVVDAAAREVWTASNRLRLDRQTHASLKNYAGLFFATVVSRPRGDLAAVDAALGTAIEAAAASLCEQAHVPNIDYPQFGVPCRAMSKLWREIKAAIAAGPAAGAPYKPGGGEGGERL